MFMRRFLCVIIALVTVFVLSSCQLHEYFGKENSKETAVDTGTSGTDAETKPDDVDVNYTIDYMNEDISGYINIAEYKGIDVEVKTYEINEEFVGKEIEKLLEEFVKSAQITDRKTAEGDKICVDYVGTLDGVAFGGGSAQNVTISLSENSGYIPGFVDGMYGVMPGETVSYEVTFPEVYQNNPDLAGKVTVFTVTIHYIEGEKIVPTLNDEFVKENFGEVGCETVEEFMEYYRSFLEEERKEKVVNDASLAAWNIIKEKTEVIELPSKAVDALYWQARLAAEEYAKSYGMTYTQFLESYGTNDEEQRAFAEDYILEDLIIFTIIKNEDMDLTEEEYNEELSAYAEKNGVTAEYLTENYEEEQIRNVFRWNKLMDSIYSWSTVTEIVE